VSEESSSLSESQSEDTCLPGDPPRITLTPSFQAAYVIGQNTGFRIRVEASDACNISSYIFRYYQKEANAVTGDADQVFSGVCSWAELEDLPIGEPESGASPGSFRLDYFDIVVDSETLATDLWEAVQASVQTLVRTVRDGGTLETGTPVVIDGADL
jgi:hypothetical protein